MLVLVAALMGGATCGDATTGAPAEGSGGADASSAADVSATDCRKLPTADPCRRRSGCKWVSVTCGEGRVVAGCFPDDAGPESMIGCSADAGGTTGGGAYCPSDANCAQKAEDAGGDGSADEADATEWDAGGSDTAAPSDASGADAAGTDIDAQTADSGSACDGYSTESTCQSDSQCRWWVGTCDGYVVEEKCIEKDGAEPSFTCKSIAPEDCHEQSESTCYPPNCEWVEEGCGGGTGTTKQVEGCLPSNHCRTDADCPTDHQCVSIWLDPCHDGSCTACGVEEKRCVEDSLL